MRNRIKNFERISHLLFEKCKRTNPLFGIMDQGFASFVSSEGRAFFEKKGVDVYLKTARAYYRLMGGKRNA